MIITCINCKKKFEVDSSLIPENGRTIQCGSCNHVWFYTPEIKKASEQPPTKISKIDNLIDKNKKETDNKIPSEKEEKDLKNIPTTHNDTIKKENDLNKKLKNKKSSFNLSKFLSYFLVLIISFASLIILLDTFKSPLSVIFPDLEIILYNLFETIKDIYLFLKNLFI